MPRNDPMTWTGHPYYRWHRMLKGERLYCSCKSLDLPPDQWTESGSRTAMRGWWEAQTAERLPVLDQPTQAVKTALDVVSLAGLLDRYKSGAAAETILEAILDASGGIQDAEAVVEKINKGENLPAGRPGTGWRVLENMKAEARQAAQEDVVQTAARTLAPNAPPARTLTYQLSRWLEEKRLVLRPKPYKNLESIIAKWKKLSFLPADVGSIDAEVVRSFLLWIKREKLSDSQQCQHGLYFRAFVRHLDKMDILDRLPKNLDCLTIEVTKKQVGIVDLAEVQELLAGLKPFHRLYALLVLNTGMNNTDIGQLRKDQIDGDILTRKRIKTEKAKNVPTVAYKLWPETLELLKRFKSDHPTLWLLSKEGTPLYDMRFEGDEAKSKDLIGQQWRRGGYPITLEALRRVGPQQLGENDRFSEFGSLFLGHAPAGVMRTFYSPESQKRFNLALDWLRKRILAP